MVSWKLSLLVVLSVIFVLTLDVDAGRGRRRNSVSNSNDDGTEDTAGVTRRRARIERRRNRNNAANGETTRRGRARGRGGRGGGRARGGNRGRGGRRRGRGRGRGQGRGRTNSRSLNDYALSNGRFGLSVYRKMGDDMDNFAFSPLGVYTSASLMMMGSQRATKRQISSALNKRSPIHPAFKSYNNTLVFGDDGNRHISMATGIYLKRNIQVSRPFQNKLRQFYEMGISRFHATTPETNVNDWVSSQTAEQISDLLMEGDVQANDLIMHMNALYFKGQWEEQFESANTQLQSFTTANSEVSDVDMMSRSGEFKHTHSTALRASAIEIPFKGDQFSMFIILPDEGVSLSEVETALSHELLNETLSTMEELSSFNLKLPKFTIDTHQSMKATLQHLGITHIFDASQAKLRRMTTSRNAFVSDVYHRSKFVVSEEGDVATNTVLAVDDFNVNRPFMFVVRDTTSDMNLLMGRYVNPQGGDLI